MGASDVETSVVVGIKGSDAIADFTAKSQQATAAAKGLESGVSTMAAAVTAAARIQEQASTATETLSQQMRQAEQFYRMGQTAVEKYTEQLRELQSVKGVLDAKDPEAYAKAFKQVSSNLEEAVNQSRKGQGAFRELGDAFEFIEAKAERLFAYFAVGFGIHEMMEAFKDADEQSAKLDITLENTANQITMTKEQMEDLAMSEEQRTNINHLQIESLESLLGRYRNTGLEMKRLVQDGEDLARMMGTDVGNSARILGMAFDSPEQAMMLLRRQGVLLTEQQKEQIRIFQDSGNSMAAANIILTKFEQTYKDAAGTMSTTFGQEMENVKNSIIEVMEAFGEGTGGAGVSQGIKDLMEALAGLVRAMEPVAAAFGTILYVPMLLVADAFKVLVALGPLLEAVFAGLAIRMLPLLADSFVKIYAGTLQVVTGFYNVMTADEAKAEADLGAAAAAETHTAAMVAEGTAADVTAGEIALASTATTAAAAETTASSGILVTAWAAVSGAASTLASGALALLGTALTAVGTAATEVVAAVTGLAVAPLTAIAIIGGLTVGVYEVAKSFLGWADAGNKNAEALDAQLAALAKLKSEGKSIYGEEKTATPDFSTMNINQIAATKEGQEQLKTELARNQEILDEAKVKEQDWVGEVQDIWSRFWNGKVSTAQANVDLISGILKKGQSDMADDASAANVAWAKIQEQMKATQKFQRDLPGGDQSAKAALQGDIDIAEARLKYINSQAQGQNLGTAAGLKAAFSVTQSGDRETKQDLDAVAAAMRKVSEEGAKYADTLTEIGQAGRDQDAQAKLSLALQKQHEAEQQFPAQPGGARTQQELDADKAVAEARKGLMDESNKDYERSQELQVQAAGAGAQEKLRADQQYLAKLASENQQGTETYKEAWSKVQTDLIQVRDQQVEEDKKAFDEQAKAAGNSAQAKLIAAQKYLAEVKGIYAEDSKQYKDALDSEKTAQIEFDQWRIAQEKSIAESKAGAQEAYIKAQEEITGKELTLQNASSAQKIAAETQYETQLYQLKMQSFAAQEQALIDSGKNDAAAMEAIHDDEYKEQVAYGQKMIDLQTQQAEAVQQAWKSALTPVTDAFASTFADIIDRTKKTKESVSQQLRTMFAGLEKTELTNTLKSGFGALLGTGGGQGGIASAIEGKLGIGGAASTAGTPSITNLSDIIGSTDSNDALPVFVTNASGGGAPGSALTSTGAAAQLAGEAIGANPSDTAALLAAQAANTGDYGTLATGGGPIPSASSASGGPVQGGGLIGAGINAIAPYAKQAWNWGASALGYGNSASTIPPPSGTSATPAVTQNAAAFNGYATPQASTAAPGFQSPDANSQFATTGSGGAGPSISNSAPGAAQQANIFTELAGFFSKTYGHGSGATNNSNVDLSSGSGTDSMGIGDISGSDYTSGGSFGGGDGGGGDGGGGDGGGGYASGGIVSRFRSAWANAPHFDLGGPIPIWAHAGERVLTPPQNREYEAGMARDRGPSHHFHYHDDGSSKGRMTPARRQAYADFQDAIKGTRG